MRKIIIAGSLLGTMLAYAASSFTTHYNLEKPADGDANWGDSYRSNMDIIDNQMYINQESIQDHIDDPVAAHAASAILTTPGSLTCLTQVNVQDFLDCLDTQFGLVIGGGVVTINTDQTITGLKTFSQTPIFSALSTGVLHSDANGNLSSSLIVNADVDASAAIAYSKLNLASSIQDSDIDTALSYSVLDLTDSIVDADINSSAAIAGTKIDPDFGSQNIDTTGNLSADEITATNQVLTPNVQASSSAGILFEANNGTDVATFGAGGGAQAVFSGALESLTSFILQDPGAGTETVTLQAPTLAGSYTLTLPVDDGDSGEVLITNGSGVLSWSAAGSGDVVGPASAVDNNIATFDLTTGKLIQDSGVSIFQAQRIASNETSNIGISASVAANALTIALKDSSGNDCSSTSPCYIGFRNSTLATGQFVQREITSALSLVISSGSTLGQTSAIAEDIYVYALDTGAGVVLAAVTAPQFEESSLVSTTAEGGAGGADSRNVVYTASAQTSKPVRLIGRITSTQATAGTWASAPSAILLQPFNYPYNKKGPFVARLNATASACSVSGDIVQVGSWITGCTRNNTANYTITMTGFNVTPVCQVTAYRDLANTRYTISTWQTGTKSNTSLTFQGGYNDDQQGTIAAAIANVDDAFDFDITCISLD